MDLEHEDRRIETVDLMNGDIVIDGETEIDDILVAARIAHLEGSRLKEIHEEFTIKAITHDDDDDSGNESSDKDLPDTEVQRIAKYEMNQRRGITNGALLGSRISPPEENSVSSATRTELQTFLSCKDTEEPDACAEAEYLTSRNMKPELWSGIKPVTVTGLPEKVADGVPISFLGSVHAIIEDLVVIKTSKNAPPLDLGSIVCLGDRTILGPISDTFGPVSLPYYVVFRAYNKNSELAMTIATEVYCDDCHSSYVLGNAGEVPEYLRCGREDQDSLSESDSEDLSPVRADTERK